MGTGRHIRVKLVERAHTWPLLTPGQGELAPRKTVREGRSSGGVWRIGCSHGGGHRQPRSAATPATPKYTQTKVSRIGTAGEGEKRRGRGGKRQHDPEEIHVEKTHFARGVRKSVGERGPGRMPSVCRQKKNTPGLSGEGAVLDRREKCPQG